MRDFLENIQAIWQEIQLSQKITLILASAGIILCMSMLLIWANRPQFQILYGGLSSKEGSEITTALDGMGIAYEIKSGGTAIHVPSRDVHKVRMDLASQGIPQGDSIGYEIFDRTTFGISDFVQRTNYVRAVQGELSRTISQLNGVRSARVMVVMPENRTLVINPDAVPTASVMIELGGGQLERTAVHSIRSLVANSVEGLRRENVAVIDNRGNILSEEIEEDEGEIGSVAKVNYRRKTEEYLIEKVETMLAKVLGESQSVVRVSAEIDYNSRTITEEIFDPQSQVVRSQTSTDDVQISSETRASGAVAGTAGTLDPPDNQPQGNLPGSATERSQKQRNQTFEINRSLVNTVTAPGDITRVTAAVFIAARGGDNPAPRNEQEMIQIRNMVALALGIPVDENTQTLVSIQELPFIGTHGEIADFDPQTGFHWADIFSYIREASTIGLALFFFLFFLHILRKSQITPLSSQANVSKSAEDTVGSSSAAISPEVLNELIKQKPENVGTALRNWAVPGRKP